MLWRRSILSAAVADLIELEQLVFTAKEFGAGSGYLSNIDPDEYTAEVERLTTRLVATQFRIEGLDLD